MFLFSVLTRLILGVTSLVSVGLRDMPDIGLIVTDDIAIDQQDTSPVSLSLASGSVLTPTIARFAASGSALNKGGFKAYIQSPQSYSSGAVLDYVSAQCAGKTTQQTFTIGVDADPLKTGSGVRLLARVNLAAGSAWTYSGSHIRVQDSHYLMAVSQSGAVAANSGDCVFKANWSELYTSTH